MNREVWVYRIPTTPSAAMYPTQFRIPKGARFLHCREQGQDQVGLWYEVDTNAEQVPQFFQFFGTGHSIPNSAEYRGTCLFTGGSLMLHVYEVVDGAA